MRTLITGATGFLGRHLVPHLKRPVVLSRPGSKRRGVLSPCDPIVYDWSPELGPPPAQAFDEVEVVVHLAGESLASGRWTRAKKERIYRSRVTGTNHLVRAITALSRPPRLLISASAVGYYGSRGDQQLDESSLPGHDFLADVCVAWESAARLAAERGTRVVLLRSGLILGHDGGTLASLLRPFRCGLGGRLGSGRQWMSWIHIHDLVQLIMFLCQHDTIHGPVNATSPNPATNAQFTAALGQSLHRPAWLTLPEAILHLLLGEMANVVLASQRVVPEVALQAGFQFRYPELATALAAAVKS